MGNCLSGPCNPITRDRTMDSHAAGRHGVADQPVAMDVQTGNDIIAALAQEVIPTHILAT